jgi:hypothetical protein
MVAPKSFINQNTKLEYGLQPLFVEADLKNAA